MKTSRLLRASLLAALLGASLAAHAQFARLRFVSEPGDPVGGGQTVDNTYVSTSTSPVYATLYRKGAAAPDTVFFSMGDTLNFPNDYAYLAFQSVDRAAPLAVGSYPQAQRAFFQAPGFAGLDVGFQNRGSNTLTGSFTVNLLELAVDPSTSTGYRLLRFQADFVQRSEGGTGSMRGSFTYEAVPEPASMAALGLGALGLLRRRKARA